MFHRLAIALLLTLTNLMITMPLQATPLKDHLWKNRVIITFSASAKEPERLALQKQMEEKACAFTDRNLVHIDLLQGSEDFDEMSQQFAVSSSGFQLLLLGKDGGIKLRSSTASLEDIFSLIDTMPMRRKEMRDDQCWSGPTCSSLGFSESSFSAFSILPRSSILIMRIVWSHNFQASSTHKDPLLACGNTHSKQGVHFFETLVTRFHGKRVCSVKFNHLPNQNHFHRLSLKRN